MTTPTDYIQAYAVLRIDGETIDSVARVAEWEIDGKIQPTAGPANVSVRQIVLSAQEARDEVDRARAGADRGVGQAHRGAAVLRQDFPAILAMTQLGPGPSPRLRRPG